MSSVARVSSLALAVVVAFLCVSSCTHNPASTRPQAASPNAEKAPVNKFPVIHVFVALADNDNQGIVPVSASLGNGDNPNTNLYWGAGYGVRTFFKRNKDWEFISCTDNPRTGVLERCIFKHRKRELVLVADAYQGKEIALATSEFLNAAAGIDSEKLKANNLEFNSHGSADLVAYVGHNGLMDFDLASTPRRRDDRERQAIILACASKNYFTNRCDQPGPVLCYGPPTSWRPRLTYSPLQSMAG